MSSRWWTACGKDQGEANAFYPENEEHNESFDSVSSKGAAALAAYEEEMDHLRI